MNPTLPASRTAPLSEGTGTSPATRSCRGFTLVELLITISIMAIMTVLSWRGIDGMLRARDQMQVRTDDVLTLQTALTQWTVDLDNISETQVVNPIEFDGSVLRLTRRDAVSPAEGVRVVAWARRQAGDRGYWARWQSADVRTRDELTAAWQKAAQWGREPRAEDLVQEIPLAGIDQWNLYYFRENAWTNPQSTAVKTNDPNAPPVAGQMAAVPDGVRLILTLSQGQAFSGDLTRDWVRPIVGGGKAS